MRISDWSSDVCSSDLSGCHQIAQSAIHLKRQPLLGEPLQDIEISAAVPKTLRLCPGRKDVLPPFLRLVQPRPSSSRYRPYDARSGPLRPSRCSLRRPSGDPRHSLPRKPGALRPSRTTTAPEPTRGLVHSHRPQINTSLLNTHPGVSQTKYN